MVVADEGSQPKAVLSKSHVACWSANYLHQEPLVSLSKEVDRHEKRKNAI